MTVATNRKYFVDVFMGWITEVRAIYDPSLLVKPYSYYGSITEIVDYLTVLSQNQLSKYPFVCLVDDFEEIHVSNEGWYAVNPTIYIFTDTQIPYDPQQRYDNVIKPILMLIMENLLQVIEFSSSVSQADQVLSWTKKTYKGSVAGQSIQDTVDCIELKFTNLLIKNNC